MLVNNFKPLLWFGNAGTLKNVNNADVNVVDFLGSSMNLAPSNNHKLAGVVRSFNYDITTATNSFTQELNANTWYGIVSNGNSHAQNARQSGFILFVGTGDTEVTETDYKLSSSIALSVTNASCKHNADGTTTVTRTFLNNTENEVIIKELGLYVFKYYNSETSYAVMLGRKVLTTPVLIPVGASYTFTWTIDLLKNVNLNDEE